MFELVQVVAELVYVPTGKIIRLPVDALSDVLSFMGGRNPALVSERELCQVSVISIWGCHDIYTFYIYFPF